MNDGSGYYINFIGLSLYICYTLHLLHTREEEEDE